MELDNQAEIFVEIKGFPHKFISNFGRVKYIDAWTGSEEFSKLTLGVTGYLNICLRNNKTGLRKTYQVHRLVAEYFIPNIENKPEVNHKNKIRTDNKVDNLEWCTKSENAFHKARFNKSKRVGIVKNAFVLTIPTGWKETTQTFFKTVKLKSVEKHI